MMPEWAKTAVRAIAGGRGYRAARRAYRRAIAGMRPAWYPPPTLDPPADLRARPSGYPFLVADDNPLETLGAKYQPTKRGHNFLKHYWMHFRDIRFAVRSVCEIGVQTDRSVRLWEEFFPNATIYGLDIDPQCRQYEGGRCRILIGDQSDPEFLLGAVAAAGGAFDIVIDDGSHVPDHQISTFEVLFPRLTDHGIYVVEDTGGLVNDTDLQVVNSFKGLVGHIMHWPEGYVAANWQNLSTFEDGASWADRNIIGLAFYRWIIFVFRGRNPEDNPYLKPSA